jgi:macrolide-specific efflux system membrane fusion protein
MKLKVLAIVLLLAVGGAGIVVAAGGLPKSAAAASTYLTSTTAIADVSDDVAATGAVAASTGWDLAFGSAPTTAGASASDSSSAAGSTGTWTVTGLKVKVGDTVAAKQVLATASNATLTADIAAAKNDVTSAHLQFDAAQTAYDDATTDNALSQTRVGLLNATNAYAKARAALADLQQTAARASLVAPAAGIVTAVNITAGADAPTGAAITIDSTSYQVTADVVESDVSSIQIAQPAAVTVAAIGADLTGTVTAIAPTAAASGSSGSSSGVVSYAVTIALASPPKTLRSGMTADITITTASATGVLAVPAAAIRGVAGNYSVLVLTNGTPEARVVEVGLMTSSLVEIKSGLSAGDQVVIGTSSQQRTGTTNAGGRGGGRTP